MFSLKDSAYLIPRSSGHYELSSTMKTILKSILTPGETFQDRRVEIIFTSLSESAGLAKFCICISPNRTVQMARQKVGGVVELTDNEGK